MWKLNENCNHYLLSTLNIGGATVEIHRIINFTNIWSTFSYSYCPFNTVTRQPVVRLIFVTFLIYYPLHLIFYQIRWEHLPFSALWRFAAPSILRIGHIRTHFIPLDNNHIQFPLFPRNVKHPAQNTKMFKSWLRTLSPRPASTEIQICWK